MRKIWLIGLIGAGLGGLAYYFNRKAKATKPAPKPNPIQWPKPKPIQECARLQLSPPSYVTKVGKDVTIDVLCDGQPFFGSYTIYVNGQKHGTGSGAGFTLNFPNAGQYRVIVKANGKSSGVSVIVVLPNIPTKPISPVQGPVVYSVKAVPP